MAGQQSLFSASGVLAAYDHQRFKARALRRVLSDSGAGLGRAWLPVQPFLLLFAFLIAMPAYAEEQEFYGPTLDAYSAVTCELHASRPGPRYSALQLKQMDLSNKLAAMTATLTAEQRVRYNEAYAKALSCTQPEHKPLSAEQMSKLGCKDSDVSTDEYMAAAAGDDKVKQAILGTQMAKDMYEDNLAQYRQYQREQLEAHGGGYDPCKAYDPYEHIPD